MTPDSVDVPQGTQNQGDVTENEIFLQHLLGIQLPPINRRNINTQSGIMADQITFKIASTIDATRTGVIQADLRRILNTNIQAALRRVHESAPIATVANPLHIQEARAVADAVRESIPQIVLDDFVRDSMSAVVDMDPSVPRNVFRVRAYIGVAPVLNRQRVVDIDTRHSFWRERIFATPAELETALVGQTISNVGINISNPSDVPPSYRLTLGDVRNIMTEDARIIDLNKNYHNVRTTANIGRNSHELAVDTKLLVSSRISQPAHLLNEDYVANLNLSQLTDFLSMPRNWTELVQSDGIFPSSLVDTPGGGSMRADAYLAREVFNSLGSNPTGRLAQGWRNIADVQRELSEQHRFETRLREGSDNAYGAAIAMSILTNHKDLGALLGGDDRTTVETNLNTARSNQTLLQLLEDLEAMTPPSSATDYADLESRLSDINTTEARVTRVAAGDPVRIGASIDPADEMLVPAGLRGTGADYSTVYSWLNRRRQETEAEIKAFRDIEHRLRLVANFCNAHGITGVQLLNIIDPAGGVRNPALINGRMDLPLLTNEIRGARNLMAKTKDALKTDVEGLQKQLQDIVENKNAGPHGNEAQHLIIKEYLKRYRGLTESEASAATNYMRSRTLIDGDMNAAAEAVAADIYGEEPINPVYDNIDNAKNLSMNEDKRARRIIYNVAYFGGIPMKANNYRRSPINIRYYQRTLPEPNWSRANYRNLVTAYFTMKQLYEGRGPEGIKLYQTHYVQQQMKEVSKMLLRKHSQALLKDFGSHLGIADDKQKEIVKDPTKAEHIEMLEQTLTGDVPAAYQTRIASVIKNAEANTDWWRRNLFLREDYGMIKGKKNKISARNLLFGNEYASVAGLVYRAPTRIVKASGRGVKNVASGIGHVAQGAWNRKKGIGTGALIGTLFLPGIGTAIGAAIGSSYKPKNI